MNQQQRAVVQQALEALIDATGTMIGECYTAAQQEEAITALRQLLEQPEPMQEPVAWTLLLVGEHNGIIGKAGDKFLGHPEHYQRVDVYTTPPAQPADLNLNCKSVQARLAAQWGYVKAEKADHSEQHLDMAGHGDELTIAYLDGVHTGKQIAKREWVGLTDEQKLDLISEAKGIGGRIRTDGQLLELLKEHEAKLRDKNGGGA